MFQMFSMAFLCKEGREHAASMVWQRKEREKPNGKARTSCGSKYVRTKRCSSRKYLSGCSCFITPITWVCLKIARAVSNSLSSIISRTICKKWRNEHLHPCTDICHKNKRIKFFCWWAQLTPYHKTETIQKKYWHNKRKLEKKKSSLPAHINPPISFWGAWVEKLEAKRHPTYHHWYRQWRSQDYPLCWETPGIRSAASGTFVARNSLCKIEALS